MHHMAQTAHLITLLHTPQAELENLQRDEMREDDILLRALDPSAHELPWFAGAHVLPVMPGPAARWVATAAGAARVDGGPLPGACG